MIATNENYEAQVPDKNLIDIVETANLILDPPARGAWNMAVDQALLLAAERTGQVTLRFYRWQTPTLSLGYFQKLADRHEHPGSIGCPVVRRASGGGAIVHDQELTFSLTFPSKNRWSKKNNDLYRSVHGCILEALQKFGVEAGLYEKTSLDRGGITRTETGNSGNRLPKSFLCFQRRTDGDIILDGQKVGGSAQRRAKNAILQHTSLLLRKSTVAQELPGIEDLSSIKLDEADLTDELIQRLSQTLLAAFKPAKLTFEQIKMAKKITEETFGNLRWLEKK